MEDIPEDQMANLIQAFKDGVEVKDRRYRLKTYNRCFVGSEAVDFLVQSGIAANRDDAVKFGQYLQGNKGLFRHVTGEHIFADEHLFFEFTKQPFTSAGKSPLLSLYGVKGEEAAADDDEPSEPAFSGQGRRKLLKEVEGKPPDVRKSVVIAAAEKAIREMQMADRINKQLLVDSEVNTPFTTEIKPTDMRCLALVAHNHMKPAMKAFIEGHSEILKKFRLTGTNTTMTMCRTVFGEDEDDAESKVVYGPTCTSGPLGGDAQLAALLCLEDVGAIIFFMDPLSAHPHQADIDSLVRLANVHNVILCPNPTTAVAMMWMVRQSLVNNKPEMFPSFFQTLESPSVKDYKAGQKKALESAIKS